METYWNGIQDATTHATYTSYLAHIIDCSQRLYGVPAEPGEEFMREIAKVTDDTIHLYLHRQPLSSEIMMPYVQGRRGFVIGWDTIIYGSLQVKQDEREHILPVQLCERLAKDCAWCFHLLEKEKHNQHQ